MFADRIDDIVPFGADLLARHESEMVDNDNLGTARALEALGHDRQGDPDRIDVVDYLDNIGSLLLSLGLAVHNLGKKINI